MLSTPKPNQEDCPGLLAERQYNQALIPLTMVEPGALWHPLDSAALTGDAEIREELEPHLEPAPYPQLQLV